MSFDIFAALTQPHSVVMVHNVRLVDVQQGDGGQELLTIEHAGETRALVGGGKWSDEFSRRNVGRVGYLRPADIARVAGACYFHDYIDQSLRRVPELDGTATRSEPVGWCCDAKPHGFWAPLGIIPGEGGRFVHDATVSVTLRVPPEFVRECRRVQKSPEELLRSFVGDLAGIINTGACPRADGYGSNGSDEREYADAWYERAHGMFAIDLDEVDAREEEIEEREALVGEFGDMLADFESNGGKADDLLAQVQAIVDKQAAGDGT